MSRDIDIRIARNSLYNVGRTLASIPILLALTPYIMNRIGAEEFGVWALVGVISSYAQLGDFGITDSLIRFVAEFKARNETENINRIVNTALVLYLVLGVLSFLLFMRFLPFIIRDILSIPGRLEAEVSHVFTLSIALFFANLGFSVFNSLIVGFQRLDLSNAVSLASVLLMAAGTVFFLGAGYGLVGLVYNNIVAAAFVAASNLWLSKKLFPEMKLNPLRYVDRTTLQHIWSFSWKVQLSNVSQLMIFQIDRIMISHYVGVTAVGYYEIANRVASPARSFIASIFTPMAPAASELQATGSGNLVAELYRRALKYMCMTAIPFFVLVAALAHPFLTAWMGKGYETSSITLECLAIAYAINLLTGPGAFLLGGINKPEIAMKSSLLAGLLNVVLCLVLVRTVGYYGVIMAITVSIFVSGLYFLYMLHRSVPGLSYASYPASLGRPILAALCAGALAAFVSSLWRQPSFPSLSVAASAGVALACVILTAGRYLDEYDRRTFTRLIPAGRNRT